MNSNCDYYKLLYVTIVVGCGHVAFVYRRADQIWSFYIKSNV